MGSHDPVSTVLLGLTVVLIGAKLGGELFERIGQPAVIGELLCGVLLGNLDWFSGLRIFDGLRQGEAHTFFAIFAQLGAVLLLFEVGLASSVAEMFRVGASATIVAVAGVVAPWFLGFYVGVVLRPEASFASHLFLGAILTATSVGITARVYRDLGRLQTVEARVILGAAVIDDVLGLIILAVVSGIVTHGNVGLLDVARIIFVALAFLVGAVVVGSRFAAVLSRYLSHLRVAGMKLITALIFAFALSWIAGLVGLAPIVGAFAAGLVLDESLFARFTRDRPLKELLEPVTSVFVPIFFVVMGIEVHLEALTDPKVLALAAAITLAAIVGKQVCGLVALGRGLDRVSIGVGMVPRGEVGLIFAGVGRSLGVVDNALYGASVVMVLVTTFIAPPLLQMRMKRRPARAA